MDHLQQHWLGALHVVLALLALLCGSMVLLLRKGSTTHRWLGRGYLLCMLGLNASALGIYELFGGFGAFHWLALFSLATILAGWLSARGRRPGWRQRHAYIMCGSYVGLIAASAAEVATRVPGWSFATAALISSVLAIVIGLMLMYWRLPRTLA